MLGVPFDLRLLVLGVIAGQIGALVVVAAV
jgi:hypothetical protein